MIEGGKYSKILDFLKNWTHSNKGNVILTPMMNGAASSPMANSVASYPVWTNGIGPDDDRPSTDDDYTIIIIDEENNQFPQLKDLNPLISNNSFVAGGYFKDIFSGQKPRDVDVYFTNMDEFEKTKARFLKSAAHTMIYDTDRSTGFQFKNDETLTIDLIKYRTGAPISIIKSFDFIVSKFTYCKIGERFAVIHHRLYFPNLDSKELIIDPYARPEYDGDMLFERVLKYTRYGFTLDNASKLLLFKFIKQWSGPAISTQWKSS